MMTRPLLFSFFFFFNDTATTEIYTLSLHDALPISTALDVPVTFFYDGDGKAREVESLLFLDSAFSLRVLRETAGSQLPDRKSTRLNSSHSQISHAVFCLKKKKQTQSRPLPCREV